LRASAQDKGAQVLIQHRTTGLVRNKDGRVIGLQVERMPPGRPGTRLHRWIYALLIYLRYAAMYAPFITWTLRSLLRTLESACAEKMLLRAKRGVILSTGGFFYNRAMVERHAPASLPGMPLGTIGDDGSGILMAQDSGARTALLDNVTDWRFVNPPEAFIRGILVDPKGQRICNEMLYGAQLAERINLEAGGQAWLLLDATLARQALREIGPSRAMWFQSAAALVYLFLARRKAPTLEALAAKLKIDPTALAETVNSYNTLSQAGAEDPMGKPAAYLATLESGPWYALDCRVDGGVRNPSLTLGGLCVDEATGEVLGGDGQPILGLYAAGRCAVGIASHSYVSGLSIAGCLFSGRRAGRHAAAGK
jgi:3-oxo-5alpha-steroid 4-dehydrogenase